MQPRSEITPESIVGTISLLAALTLLLIYKIREIAGQTSPDPRPQEIDRAVKASDAVPLCMECLYPQDERRWFCPYCGFPAGEYVTTMHYLYIFAIGEVLRRGVIGPPERSLGRKMFFVLCSVWQYSLFAPIYWFWMARKAYGKPVCQAQRKELQFEE